jgi:hypothetical protein
MNNVVLWQEVPYTFPFTGWKSSHRTSEILGVLKKIKFSVKNMKHFVFLHTKKQEQCYGKWTVPRKAIYL